jgi:hypothetical protein
VLTGTRSPQSRKLRRGLYIPHQAPTSIGKSAAALDAIGFLASTLNAANPAEKNSYKMDIISLAGQGLICSTDAV